MIDTASARKIVEDYLAGLPPLPDDDIWVLRDDRTREEEFGWVFFYNNRKFLESGDIRCRRLGNAPIFVNRDDGSIHVYGTAPAVDKQIEEHGRRSTARGLKLN